MQPLSEIIENFLASNPRIQSKKTRDQYRLACRNFESALMRPPRLGDLTDDDLGRLSHALISKGLAPKTVNERVGRLCSLWRWLCKTGVVRRMPLIGRIPEPVRTPQAWTIDELRALVSSLESLPGRVGNIPARDWWRALHLVAWSTGERISAILSVRWEWLHDGWLWIPAEVRKSKTSDMTYRLSDESLAALSAIREPVRDLIFPWPFNQFYLWARYRTIRRRAGLPADRKSSFHRLRKSVASHAKAAGADASHLLGHTDSRVTAKYIDPRICKPPQARDYLVKIG